MLQQILSALKGPARTLRMHQQALQQQPSILTGVEQLQRICPGDPNDREQPIFLLSAGWRSGSTLLQRLIMSDASLLMWGEPYDECGMIQSLACSLQAIRHDWPPQDYYYDGTPPGQLSGNWIANLFPSAEDLRLSHRALFDTLFAEPAKRAGATRWGIKEVRLGIEHGAYLRWLYPNAKFVFLYRNPLHAYQSYCRYGRSWYNVWPHQPVFTPAAFGRHWNELMSGFLRDANKIDALLIRYEDLVSGKVDLAELDRHLGIQMDHSVLTRKVGSSERGGEQAPISALEKWLLKRAVSPTAATLGYHW